MQTNSVLFHSTPQGTPSPRFFVNQIMQQELKLQLDTIE